MVTTIQLEERVKRKLDELKLHPRETYNKVIERLVHEATQEDLSDKAISDLESALDDIKHKRVYDTAHVVG